MSDENFVSLGADERDDLRVAAYGDRLTPGHATAILRLADELDEDNNGTAAAVVRALLALAFPETQ